MEHEVRKLKLLLEARGYVVPYDWTEFEVLKPFEENLEAADRAAEAMAKAVMNCDILIVVCAPDGVGYHIETGGALVTSIILDFILGRPHKQIYVVGPENDRSVFYFHSSVKRMSTPQEVLEDLPNLKEA